MLLVTTNAGTAAGSLPNAIAQAVAGDLVTFDPALAGQPIILASPVTINKAITIQGLGADKIILSGAGTNRLLNVTSANPVSITGMTLANGLTVTPNTNGGAILNTGKLILDSDTFTLNLVLEPGSEGGATGAGASVTITNCSFSGGFATGGGGVLFNDTTSAVTIDTSTLTGNRASANGSGIDNKGQLTISSSTLSQEIAAAGGNLGGAINNEVGATVTVKGSDIITVPGGSSGPEVKVFNGTQVLGNTSPATLLDFFAYDPAFGGGVRVAVVDTNGDGLPTS
jgi:hypothetical protein